MRKSKIYELSNNNIYNTSEEYRKEYVRCKKNSFRPLDDREYRSLKIMYHKCLPKYYWSNKMQLHISKAYNGAGFTLLNKNYILNNNKKYLLNIYDINSAYQYTLINDIYVLSNKHKVYNYVFKDITLDKIFKVFKNKKYICYIEFKGLTPKYDYVDYNIYQQQLSIKMYKDKITQIGWLCDIDLNNLVKLYNFEYCKIYYLYHFLEIGKLKVKDFIKEKYEKLHSIANTAERKNYKTMLHITTYGKSAQRTKYEWEKRSKYSIIAIYQSAYVRQRMINIFLKYKKDIAYIDTDSVFIRSNVKPAFKIGNNIGDFKTEYKQVKAYINRIKAYILYRNNKRILYKWSGLQKELTEKQVQKIEKGYIIEVKEKREGKEQLFKLYNKYIIGDLIEI